MQQFSNQLFYYVIADSVAEQHISIKFFKCNSFQVPTDLLNSENLKVTINQLCHELQIYKFTILKVTEKYLNNTFKENNFKVTTDLLNSENLKVAMGQLYNELQACNLTKL